MLKNYLTIAWRNLVRYKLYSLVNLVGLAIGMAACLLILLFVKDELSYDKFHKDVDRIYRITSFLTFTDTHFASTGNPLGPTLEQQHFKGIEAIGRLFQRSAGMTLEQNPGRSFVEDQFYWADSGILEVFTFKFLLGDGQKALVHPGSLILSRTMAEKYFGQDWKSNPNVYGSIFNVDGKESFSVTAVVEDFPHNAHFHFKFLASFANMYTIDGVKMGERMRKNWMYNPFHHYVLLEKGVTPEDIENRLPEFIQTHSPDYYHKNNILDLQPITEIHLNSNKESDLEPASSMTVVRMFSTIALITLLIACINFINLSTARSIRRAREVGMRKVLGASRVRLMIQFLSESLMLSVFALMVSLLFLQFFIPVLNDLTGKELSMTGLGSLDMLLGMVGVVVLTGVIAGSYPAFFVSSFKPVQSLKGNVSEGISGGQWLRKGLVVMQFLTSIALIAGSLILYDQMRFLQTKELGFQKEHLIGIPLFPQNTNLILAGGVDSTLRQRMNTFEEDAMTSPGITAITLASAMPGLNTVMHNVIPEGFTREDNMFIPNIAVDYDYVHTLGLEIVAGRDFDEKYGTDPLNAFILNEKAVKDFQWKTPQDAIGKFIDREGKKGNVIGIVKDFHVTSLREPIRPVLMDVMTPRFNTFLVRIRAQDIPATLEGLSETWKTHFPEKVFNHSFLDDRLNEAYEAESKTGKIVSYFSFLAIFVSCLGLFGLTAFAVERRTREIGIRKVLGATTRQIARLLFGEFTLLVLAAFVLAVPLAWFTTSDWLDGFAYHVTLGPWPFVWAGLLTLLVAGATVLIQAYRAARTDPAKVLRDE